MGAVAGGIGYPSDADDRSGGYWITNFDARTQLGPVGATSRIGNSPVGKFVMKIIGKFIDIKNIRLFAFLMKATVLSSIHLLSCFLASLISPGIISRAASATPRGRVRRLGGIVLGWSSSGTG